MYIFFFILSNHLELFGLASKTAEVEVDWSYIEQGFFCHRKASLRVGKPKDDVEEEDRERTRGASWNNGKGFERGQGNRWKESPLALV